MICKHDMIQKGSGWNRAGANMARAANLGTNKLMNELELWEPTLNSNPNIYTAIINSSLKSVNLINSFARINSG